VGRTSAPQLTAVQVPTCHWLNRNCDSVSLEGAPRCLTH
jgi:hypothetical protein